MYDLQDAKIGAERLDGYATATTLLQFTSEQTSPSLTRRCLGKPWLISFRVRISYLSNSPWNFTSGTAMEGSDVVLVVGDAKFHAHRAVSSFDVDGY